MLSIRTSPSRFLPLCHGLALAGVCTLLSPACKTTASPEQSPPAVAAPAPAPALEVEKAENPTAPEDLRRIGYFTNWAHKRSGDCKFEISDIDASLLTHINYAFAKVEAGDRSAPEFRLAAGDPADLEKLYPEMRAFADAHPHLKTLLSVGGWTFNDPPSEWIFTTLAETPKSRAQFIANAIAFVRTHGFQGIDLDWEYPGVPDRGGRSIDSENFTALLAEFRSAISAEASQSGLEPLLLTIAAPAGSYHYKHMQLGEIHKSLDWINLMAYDFHGAWDKNTGHNAPLAGDAKPSISQSVDAYLAAGVPANKLVLGMPTYGRGWKGAPQSAAGRAAQGPADAAPCTAEAGYFASYEIADIIADEGLSVQRAEHARVPFAHSEASNLWFSYDDEASIGAKAQYVVDRGLAGAMFWAIDLDDYHHGYPLMSTVGARFKAARANP